MHQQSHSSRQGGTRRQHRKFFTSWIRYKFPAYPATCLLKSRSKLLLAHCYKKPIAFIKPQTHSQVFVRTKYFIASTDKPQGLFEVLLYLHIMGFASPIPKRGRRRKIDSHSAAGSPPLSQLPVSIATRELCREVTLTVGSYPMISMDPKTPSDNECRLSSSLRKEPMLFVALLASEGYLTAVLKRSQKLV